MTKSVKIVINASALGVTTGVEVDGKLVSNRTIVPASALDSYISLKPGDLISDMEGHYSLAELLTFRLEFLDTDLMEWFLDGGDNV